LDFFVPILMTLNSSVTILMGLNYKLRKNCSMKCLALFSELTWTIHFWFLLYTSLLVVWLLLSNSACPASWWHLGTLVWCIWKIIGFRVTNLAVHNIAKSSLTQLIQQILHT
jgi:hypothetical protein